MGEHPAETRTCRTGDDATKAHAPDCGVYHPIPAHGADDETVCEYVGCSNEGWVVLHFGPRLTPPLRVACRAHMTETDLSMFPERFAGRPNPYRIEGGGHE